jgi:hypothetical protein
MSNTKIITQTREIKDNEILFRRGFNFKDDHEHTDKLLTWIEKHTDIQFEWISAGDLVGGSHDETAGLRIIKKSEDRPPY